MSDTEESEPTIRFRINKKLHEYELLPLYTQLIRCGKIIEPKFQKELTKSQVKRVEKLGEEHGFEVLKDELELQTSKSDVGSVEDIQITPPLKPILPPTIEKPVEDDENKEEDKAENTVISRPPTPETKPEEVSVEDKPVEDQPVEDQPVDVEDQLAAPQPVEDQPVEDQPVDVEEEPCVESYIPQGLKDLVEPPKQEPFVDGMTKDEYVESLLNALKDLEASGVIEKWEQEDKGYEDPSSQPTQPWTMEEILNTVTPDQPALDENGLEVNPWLSMGADWASRVP